MDINPFLIKGYIDPEHFCDREKETKRMVEAVRNQRNITLFSQRRMGKTGLIHHVFHKLDSPKKVQSFYVDIMGTNNLKEFVNTLANAIIGKLESKPMQFLKKTGQTLAALRPLIKYDNLTGEPSVEFDIRSEDESKRSIAQLFDYLNENCKKKKIIIAIDEFQQILNYPEHNVEALLRSHIQSLPNIAFIFSGSHKHMLFSIFGNNKRPFYQSTELMHLEKIENSKYSAFIQYQFKKRKMSISEENIAIILDWTRTHTFYVQFVCNKLFSKGVHTLDKALIYEVFKDILEENEPLYYSYRNLLSEHQWRLMAAIAKENGVKKIMGKDFIKKYNLSTSSTVQTAIKSLMGKEMVYEDKDLYYVSDVFFSRWLGR